MDQLHYVMCHHPHTWLLDGVDHDENMAGAHVRVTGHLHRRRLAGTERGVYLEAGAVSPRRDRKTGEYWSGQEPTYDIVCVSEAESDGESWFKVSLRSRRWDDKNEIWKEDPATDSQLSRRIAARGQTTEDVQPVNLGAGATLDEPWREVRYKLYRAQERNQLQTAAKIGAPRPEIQSLPPHRRVPAIVEWAKDNGALERLWSEVTGRPDDYPGREQDA